MLGYVNRMSQRARGELFLLRRNASSTSSVGVENLSL